MSPAAKASDTSNAHDPDLGASEYIAQLSDHILQHMSNDNAERSLIIGIFGEWGCGKTHWLQQINEGFKERYRTALDEIGKPEDVASSELIIPVFFNAWRHEKEEHLIIPLMKCMEAELRKSIEPKLKDEGFVTAVRESLFDVLGRAKDSCLALACGLKGKLKLSEFAELEISPKGMLDADKAHHEARKNRKADKELSPLYKIYLADRYESLYYDFETTIRALTTPEGSGIQLKILFLIDDLDRCIPEKAIDILESIKLFLDVPGCSFVLAVDEEIVERGVMHRYKEYLFENRKTDENGDSESVQAPITGHDHQNRVLSVCALGSDRLASGGSDGTVRTVEIGRISKIDQLFSHVNERALLVNAQGILISNISVLAHEGIKYPCDAKVCDILKFSDGKFAHEVNDYDAASGVWEIREQTDGSHDLFIPWPGTEEERKRLIEMHLGTVNQVVS